MGSGWKFQSGNFRIEAGRPGGATLGSCSVGTKQEQRLDCGTQTPRDSSACAFIVHELMRILQADHGES